jgi:hypothetical protein
MQVRAKQGRRGGTWALLLAALLLCCGVAQAQRTEGDRAAATGVYDAEVAVRNQTEGERNAALGRALAQVLAKVTGDRGAATRPGVREELSRARSYVSGFDYRQDEGLSASGAPTFQTTLVARFKREAVDDLIQMLGLSTWPEPRPKPVLWMAIDDGSGPRLVALGQVNAARAVLDQAKARGYALGLPAGNAAEQAAVGAIWRGDTAAVASLSRRYSPPMQLLGKLYRGDGGWVADWTFVDRGRVLSQWSTRHADARRAMAGGADGAADALFKRYAKAGTGGPAGTYRVRVQGVRSADDYLRLVGYLERAATVKRVRPVFATGDVLELDLELATGIAGFARIAGRDGVMTSVSGEQAPGSEARTTTFRLGGN